MIMQANLKYRFYFEKLLPVQCDTNMVFNDHNSDICNQATRKISVLTKFAIYMGIGKKRMLFYTSYCFT